MTTASLPLATRFILHDVSWRGYETILEELGNRHVFVTYDQGTLEFMSPSPKHGRVSTLISRLIWAYTEERGIAIASYGMTTFRREDIEKGLEPDDCFYIANEPTMRGRDQIDLSSDPPPDLAIEVDVTRSALDRQEIYQSLKIPELWVWENDHLTIYLLNSAGVYQIADRSQAFPTLPPADVQRFVGMRHSMDELSWIRAFRTWIRSLPGAGASS
jgi:Uma2 family endonuclease